MNDVLKRITDFAIKHGNGTCFGGWPRDFIEQYLAFHMLQNTLALVHDGNDVVAIGTATQTNELDPRWNWKPTDPKGKFLLILDVINSRPGAISLLFLQMFKLWPPGTVQGIFATRHQRIQEITPKYIKLTLKAA